MKKLFLGILVVAAFVAFAIPAQAQLLPGADLRFDLSVLPGGPAAGQTDVFSRLNGQTVAVSTYNTGGLPTAGDSFTDSGTLVIGSLFADNGTSVTPIDDLGLGTGNWTLVATWDDVMGNVVSDDSGILGFDYISGSMILTAQYSGGAAIQVGAFDLTGGTGVLDLNTGLGSINMDLVFTDALTGFWQDASGNDIATLLASGGSIDVNLHTNTQASIVPGGPGGQTVITTVNGTDVDVTIPEPASMALLASGLLGLVGFRKKRA